MVRHGMTNRRIAALRGTTLDAVKFHLENIREKLGLSTRHAMRHWDGVPRRLSHRRNPMPATGPTTVALGHIGKVSHAVKDIEKAVAFQGEPHLIHRHEDGTEEWMSFFADPEGNTLALMSQVKSQARR